LDALFQSLRNALQFFRDLNCTSLFELSTCSHSYTTLLQSTIHSLAVTQHHPGPSELWSGTEEKLKKTTKNTVVYVHFLHNLSFFNEIIQSSYNTHTPSVHLVFDILTSFNVKHTWLNWVISLSRMF